MTPGSQRSGGQATGVRFSGPRVVVALDYPDADSALAFAGRLEAGTARLKVGKELFTAAGPAFVQELVQLGFDVFLDLKFHDIPNTVAQACKAAARLGVWMLNVHALGGRAMMEAAREALEGSERRPHLIAVTVLTSMADEDLREVGIEGTAMEEVLRLSSLASESGLDGVVCSAHEAQAIRQLAGPAFMRVTPGIRLPEDAPGDQKRVMTPARAIEAGASHLVIGRSITRAARPRDILARINTELANLENNG
jgi:orotidine-5'-phosphate decarboxylase